jgi:hypothetical protein
MQDQRTAGVFRDTVVGTGSPDDPPEPPQAARSVPKRPVEIKTRMVEILSRTTEYTCLPSFLAIFPDG